MTFVKRENGEHCMLKWVKMFGGNSVSRVGMVGLIHVSKVR